MIVQEKPRRRTRRGREELPNEEFTEHPRFDVAPSQLVPVVRLDAGSVSPAEGIVTSLEHGGGLALPVGPDVSDPVAAGQI